MSLTFADNAYEVTIYTQADSFGCLFSGAQVNSKEYEVACFIRHLAMAAVGGGWMSDYDVVPLAIPACAPLSNDGRFTTHQGFVPSLVSGTGAEYLRVTKLMATIPWRENMELFQTSDGRPIVSDMKALSYLRDQEAIESYPEMGDNPLCGVVPAPLVFSPREAVSCYARCAPRLLVAGPGPLSLRAISTSEATQAATAIAFGQSSEVSGLLVGPLAAHLSHDAVTAMTKKVRFKKKREEGCLFGLI